MKLFIDTSAFISGLVEEDINHKKAIKFLEELSDDIVLTTSDLVYFECLTVLSIKFGIEYAHKFSKAFRKQNFIIYGISNIEIYNAEKALFTQKSKNLPFFDCLYAAIIKHNNLDGIFTYDRHFDQLGVKVFG